MISVSHLGMLYRELRTKENNSNIMETKRISCGYIYIISAFTEVRFFFKLKMLQYVRHGLVGNKGYLCVQLRNLCTNSILKIVLIV